MIIANMDEVDVNVLQEGLMRHILPDMNDDPDGLSKVMAELHRRLRDTHKLRVVG